MSNFEKPLPPEENIDEIERILTELENNGKLPNVEELQKIEARVNKLSRNVDSNELERRFAERMKKIFGNNEKE